MSKLTYTSGMGGLLQKTLLGDRVFEYQRGQKVRPPQKSQPIFTGGRLIFRDNTASQAKSVAINKASAVGIQSKPQGTRDHNPTPSKVATEPHHCTKSAATKLKGQTQSYCFRKTQDHQSNMTWVPAAAPMLKELGSLEDSSPALRFKHVRVTPYYRGGPVGGVASLMPP